MTCRLTQSKSPEKWVDQFIECGISYKEMIQLVDIFDFSPEKEKRIRLEYMRRILSGKLRGVKVGNNDPSEYTLERQTDSDEHDTGGFRISNKEARQARLRLVVNNQEKTGD